MELSKEQMLELTRCGLWGRELNLSLFAQGVDWDEVLQLAKQQTLLGIISVAIEKLPMSMRPERNKALRLHQMVLLNKQYRKHHVEVLGKLLELVGRAGVERPVLLKGLGVGLNYHDPTLRQCGDIDLYVGEDYYFKVWDFICLELGVEKEENFSDHHFDFEFMDTNIEIHRYATAPRSVAFNNEEFQKWSKSQLEGDELREVSIDGVSLFLPPYNFDFIFIFYHTWRHFLTGGVGLRQLCDWGCYASTFSDKIDRSEIKRLVTLFKIEKPISLFATIVVRALGVAPEAFFCYAVANDRLYESALEKIWSRGNFGSYNVDLQRRNKGFVARKFLGIFAMFRDMNFLATIDRRYALRFYYLSFFTSVRFAVKELQQSKSKTVVN
ncbi:MAG: nucleotidyltransferase family protein [Rikenellaceae bacterium]